MTQAAELPNPDEFSKNEKPREYDVRLYVTGTIHTTVFADSEEDARDKAALLCQDDEIITELDEADDVQVQSVRKSPAMYRVNRDGQIMQVSRLQAGDLPRQPDDRGF